MAAQFPTSVQSRLELLKIEEKYWESKDYERCLKACDALFESNTGPPKASLYVKRARVLFKLGNFSKSMADAVQAFRSEPGNAKAYAIHGYASFESLTRIKRPNSQTSASEKREIKSVTQKMLKQTFESLSKAKNLDPTLLTKDEQFKRYWDASQNENAAWKEADSIEAVPFSTRQQRSGITVASMAVGGEDLLASMADTTAGYIPSSEDSVLLKTELLYFLSSLSRRTFHATSPTFLDTVRGVKTVGEHRKGLLRAESKVTYEAQKPSWQMDRQAWQTGLEWASCPGELLVGLKSIKKSMRSWAFETRPDRLAQQVRATVNDLDAFQDEGLDSHHDGECTEVCMSLLSKAIAEIPIEYCIGLCLLKARTLASEYDNGALAEVGVLNMIISAHAANPNICSRQELETAFQLKANAIKRWGGMGEPRSPVAAIVGVLKKPRVDPYNVDGKLTQEQHVSKLWHRLNDEERQRAFEISDEQLQKHVPDSLMRSVLAPLTTLGTSEDLLAAYQRPLVAQSSNRHKGDGLASQKEPWHNLPNDSEGLMAARKVAERSMDDFPVDWAFWNEFPEILDNLVSSTRMIELKLANGNDPIVSSITIPKRLRDWHESMPRDSAPYTNTELAVLSQRETFPRSFNHTEITKGWIGDETSLVNSHPSSSLGSLLISREVDVAEDLDTVPGLLLESTYFIQSPDAENFDILKGMFVSTLCAQVCHDGVQRKHVGRVFMRSECGVACCLCSETAITPLLTWVPTMHRVNKQTVSMVNGYEEGKLKGFLHSRPQKLMMALQDSLMHGDNEEILLTRVSKAAMEAETNEIVFRRFDRLKWGFEQLKLALQWTHSVQRALMNRLEEKQIREIEVFVQRCKALRDFVEKGYSAKSSLTRMPEYVNERLQRALESCNLLFEERQQLMWKINQAKGSLTIDEEKLFLASSVAAHSHLSSGLESHSPPTDAVQVMQQQVLRAEEFAKLSTAVLSGQQHVALLDQRVAEATALAANASIYFFKTFGAIFYNFVENALVLECSPNEFLGALEETVSLSISPNPYHLEDTIKRDLLSRMALHRDVANCDLAKSLVEVLCTFPRNVSAATDALDDTWRTLDYASDRCRAFVVKRCSECIAPWGLSSSISNGPGCAYNAVQELTQIVGKQRFEYTKALAQVQWRRAEFYNHVHLRNQFLFCVFSKAVMEKMTEIHQKYLSEQIAQTLLEDEERHSNKASKVNKKKKLSLCPSLNEASDQFVKNKQDSSLSAVEPERAVGEAVVSEVAIVAMLAPIVPLVVVSEARVFTPSPPLVYDDGDVIDEDDFKLAHERVSEWVVVQSKKANSVAQAERAAAPLKLSANEGKFALAGNAKGKREENGEKFERKEKFQKKWANGKAEQKTPRISWVPLLPAPSKRSNVVVSKAVAVPTTANYPAKELEPIINLPVVNLEPVVIREKTEGIVNSFDPVPVVHQADDDSGIRFGRFKADLRFGNFDADSDDETVKEALGDGGYGTRNEEKRVSFAGPPHTAIMMNASPNTTEFPPTWYCPLTRDLMIDPVLASDGYSYERIAILKHMADSNVSPMTGEPLSKMGISTSHSLRVAIQESHFQRQIAYARMYSAERILLPPPPPPPPKICQYFQRGMCRYGPGCRDLHMSL